ncbi:FAD-dependent monooxygenase [Microtetraspora sp. NBRC 16547]|uniref:FAD-dependent oxidoreductase n=1 Tax=Microtetraspora sp. NBRC 16547 TaxID=3030993 RepID=UPI0024A3A633|nr:FAD-dependent monooxygenase [Microtetraspora sp. NBRC 16547]GLX02517.1 hydroxylase [Microtetraspora sp. NBRC 16547]
MTRRVGEHAIVLGAGISGLLAARVLTDFYDQVTLIERDVLNGDKPRKGVPQGFHGHALLPRGLQIMEELYPGLTEGMIAGGAVPYEMIVHVRMIMGGFEFARIPTGESGVSATRPFLESHILRRARELDRLVIADRSQVTGLLTEENRVVGVGVAGEDGPRELRADLVVDAMGRGGRTPAWLEAMGFDRPQEETVKVEVAYATWYLRLPEAEVAGDRMIIVGTYPGRLKGAALCAVEGDRWLVTLGGSAGVRPPADPEGFLAWLDEVAPADVAAAVRRGEPLGEIGVARIPTSVRRRYERLDRFPEGLLVTGDAVCNFNPVYGQGMTVGALDALALRDSLRDGTRDLAGRYFAAVARALDSAWQMSTGADLALREAKDQRTVASRVLNAYLSRLQRVAARDSRVAVAFSRVSGLIDPPSALVRPAVMWRILRG